MRTHLAPLLPSRGERGAGLRPLHVVQDLVADAPASCRKSMYSCAACGLPDLLGPVRGVQATLGGVAAVGRADASAAAIGRGSAHALLVGAEGLSASPRPGDGGGGGGIMGR